MLLNHRTFAVGRLEKGNICWAQLLGRADDFLHFSIPRVHGIPHVIMLGALANALNFKTD